MTRGFSGWRNYETFNVATWLRIDPALRAIVRRAANAHGPTYAAVVVALRDIGVTETGDGVAFNDSGLDTAELDKLVKELSA